MPIPAGLLGPYPGGYSIREGTELRFSNDGLEASVTYDGPWENSSVFLGSIFGEWNVTIPTADAAAGGAKCTALLANEPCPLPTAWTTPGGTLTVDSSEMFLYPDTYRIRQSGDPTSTVALDAGGSACVFTPIFGCDAAITVNYRQKWHARWPSPYIVDINNVAVCLCNSSDKIVVGQPNSFNEVVPAIAAGTFIEVLEFDQSIELQTIPVALKYTPTPTESEITAGKYQYPADSKCSKKDSDGTVIQNPDIPKEINDSIPIFNIRFTVRWTHLPFVPDSFRAAEGRINDDQFLEFPKWSVYFLGAKKVPRGVGTSTSKLETVDVDLEFLAKMVDAPTISGGTIEEQKSVREDMGIVCGRMGYYNRRWSKCKIEANAAQTDAIYETNWVTIETKDGDFLTPDYPFKDIFTTSFA